MSKIQEIKNAIILSSKDGWSVFAGILGAALITFGYWFAIDATVGWEIFVLSNNPTYVWLQIILSALNIIIGGIAIALAVYTYRNQRTLASAGGSTMSGLTLIASILTTGCYACGSLLLPFVGLASTLGSLPLAGLEIKIFTLFVMAWTIQDTATKVLGICKIESNKKVSLNFGNGNIIFPMKYWHRSRPVVVASVLLIFVFTLPTFFPVLAAENINAGAVCVNH